MSASPIYVSRLARLPLIAADGSPIGNLTDTVLLPSGASPAPVLGFVASVQRRNIFVNAARVGSIDPTGVRMRSGTIDVRPFKPRTGEKLVIADLFGKPVDDDFIIDVAIELEVGTGTWFVASVALGGRGPLRRRRTSRVVTWAEIGTQFDAGPEYAEVAEMRQMHAADVA